MKNKLVVISIAIFAFSNVANAIPNDGLSAWADIVPADGASYVSMTTSESDTAAGAIGPVGVAIVGAIFAGAGHAIDNENATIAGTIYVAASGALGALVPGGSLTKTVVSGATSIASSFTAKEYERSYGNDLLDRHMNSLDLSSGR